MKRNKRHQKPHWTKAKHKRTCYCGVVIEKGARALHYPGEHRLACTSCGRRTLSNMKRENKVLIPLADY